jgi:thiaminase
MMEIDFETEYQLKEFRDIQPEHFDSDGNAYKLYISTHICNRMLKLINQLEKNLNESIQRV